MTGLGLITACSMGIVAVAIGTTLFDLADSKREAALKQLLKKQCTAEVSQVELTIQNRYQAETILRISPHIKAACASLS